MSDQDALIKQFEQLAKMLQDKGDLAGAVQILLGMGARYSGKLGENQKAIDSYKRAMEIAFTGQYWPWYYKAVLDLGSLYIFVLKDFPTALVVFQEALANGKEDPSEPESLKLRSTIEATIHDLKRISENEASKKR